MVATSSHADVADWLEERQSRFIQMANTIWENPEVALTEAKACELQINDLELDGFKITRNVGGLRTAFMAEWGHGGPVIGFLGEYDALPGLSQERSSIQQPIVPDGPGHGCGHNLLGTGALAAASVVKAWLERTGTPGTVRYYGCPAEETNEGKNFMARAGAFDDVDIAITWHPGAFNAAAAASSLAVTNLKFRFKGVTAHAAGNPEGGRSALDAIELMNVGVNYLREHMSEKARIHYVITNGGGAPNVVPDEAESWYFVRAPERPEVDALLERVSNVARGAALMTDTKLQINVIAGIYNVLPNLTIARQLQSVLEELGPIDFTEEEHQFANTIADTYPRALREAFLRTMELPENLVDQGLTGDVFPIKGEGKVMPGSTDVADVSWVTPTAQVNTTCFVLGAPGHSWANTATAGMSIGHKGMIHAAKAMAITAVDFMTNPELIQQAKQEFAEKAGGRKYVAAIPPDVQPRDPLGKA